MKTKFTLRGIAELIGITAVVASLIFVGQQIIQAQAIALNEMGMMRLQISVDANDQINENADIWAAGLEGEALAPAESIIFENLLINLNDLNYSAGRNLYTFMGESVLDTGPFNDFAAFLHRHPGARRVWELREARLQASRAVLDPDAPGDPYSTLYVNAITSALDKLDDSTD